MTEVFTDEPESLTDEDMHKITCDAFTHLIDYGVCLDYGITYGHGPKQRRNALRGLGLGGEYKALYNLIKIIRESTDKIKRKGD